MRTSRLVLPVVLPAILLLAGTLAVLPVAHSRSTTATTHLTPAAAKRVKIRIGTYNLNQTNHLATLLTAAHKMLPSVDVVVFQEVNGVTRLSHLSHALNTSKGWKCTYEVEYGDVVAYRTSRFKALGEDNVVLAEGRQVEVPTTGQLHFKHGILAGITRLQEKTTGRLLNLVTAHPMAGAAPKGLPHAHRPRLVSMYREIITNLARVTPIQAHFGRTFLAGDINIDYYADARHRIAGFPYRQFTRIGYHSMWAGHRAPRTGTIGHAFLDGVWARQRPIRRQILTNFRYSDHKPVIATYWLP